MKYRKIIFGILIIGWIILIFTMSNQTGPESAGVSDKIVDASIDTFVKDYDTYEISLQERIHKALSLIVRKLAHFNEFGLFSLFVFGFFFEKKAWLRAIIALAATLMLAISDEIHQLFVSQRSGAPLDVLIDFSGACLYVLILSLIFRRWKNEKQGNIKSN